MTEIEMPQVVYGKAIQGEHRTLPNGFRGGHFRAVRLNGKAYVAVTDVWPLACEIERARDPINGRQYFRKSFDTFAHEHGENPDEIAPVARDIGFFRRSNGLNANSRLLKLDWLNVWLIASGVNRETAMYLETVARAAVKGVPANASLPDQVAVPKADDDGWRERAGRWAGKADKRIVALEANLADIEARLAAAMSEAFQQGYLKGSKDQAAAAYARAKTIENNAGERLPVNGDEIQW